MAGLGSLMLGLSGCPASNGTDGGATCADAGAMVQCGKNTTLSGNSCNVAPAVCGAGTMFDSATSTCTTTQVKFGDLVVQSPIALFWGFVYKMDTTPVDPGIGCMLPAGTADTEGLYMGTGEPLGYNPAVPVHWFADNISSVTTANDHQITVGEWKKCTANMAIYKNPPSGKKNYLITVDMANCPPNLLFSVWNSYAGDGEFANIGLSVPCGGLPNVMTTDLEGKAHFERELDPNIWFKEGAMLKGSAHATMNPEIIPSNTNGGDAGTTLATFWLDIALHNDGSSNGNPGFCDTQMNGDCLAMPSPNVYLPGALTVDWTAAFLGASGPNSGCPAANTGGAPANVTIPLDMVQPY
jgi:hypothetical protein